MSQEHVIIYNGSNNNQMRAQSVSDVTLTFDAGAAVGRCTVHVSAFSVNEDSSPFDDSSPQLPKKNYYRMLYELTS
jgi:hypothetical protein